MIILANEGLTNEEIAERLTTDNDKVGRRRKRFSQHGFAGIERDAPRPGRIPAIVPEIVEEVVRKTTPEVPRSSTHWSAARLAKERRRQTTSRRT